MSDAYQDFACELVRYFLQVEPRCQPHPQHGHCLLVARNNGEMASLNLIPPRLAPKPATAEAYFAHVSSAVSLLDAWRAARKNLQFETNLPEAMQRVHPYAHTFIQQLITTAEQQLSDEHATLIAGWIKQFDIYTAVKCVESLLNSRADLKLLCIAQLQGWQVHFDHLAIRCGSSAHRDAERVMTLLCEQHGYSVPQIAEEQRYHFKEGWNACMAYKLLDNGQLIRLFIDQSDADRPAQIIQHWNRVYGYTAHHLAIRITRVVDGERQAVALQTLINMLLQHGVQVLTPTGLYTAGLLEQVFTRPERDHELPQELLEEMALVDEKLIEVIRNGKLLEVVSRREMPAQWKARWHHLHGMEWQAQNPLHSVPIYHYFLPAQAAHVIRTSVQTQ